MKTKALGYAVLTLLVALALAAVGAGAAPAVANDTPRHGESNEHACGKHRHDGDGKRHRGRCDGGDDDDAGSATAPDLRPALSCDRTTIASGDTVVCTLDISSGGTAPAMLSGSAIAVRVTVPGGFQIVATGGFFICDLAADATWADLCFGTDTTIAVGSVASGTIQVKAPSVSCIDPAVTGDATVVADPNGVLAESDEANNSSTVALTVSPASC